MFWKYKNFSDFGLRMCKTLEISLHNKINKTYLDLNMWEQ